MPPKDRRILASLGYILWPLALVVVLFDKRRDFAWRESVNSLGFWVCVLILGAIVSLVGWIPLVGWIIDVAFVVIVILLVIKYALDAYKGRKTDVPFATDFLRKNVKGFR